MVSHAWLFVSRILWFGWRVYAYDFIHDRCSLNLPSLLYLNSKYDSRMFVCSYDSVLRPISTHIMQSALSTSVVHIYMVQLHGCLFPSLVLRSLHSFISPDICVLWFASAAPVFGFICLYSICWSVCWSVYDPYPMPGFISTRLLHFGLYVWGPDSIKYRSVYMWVYSVISLWTCIYSSPL